MKRLNPLSDILGEAGKPGTNKSAPGPPGTKADKDPAGSPGSEGPRGPKGDKGQDGAGGSGVKYVRWGRTTCPSGAQMVYEGKMNLRMFKFMVYARPNCCQLSPLINSSCLVIYLSIDR